MKELLHFPHTGGKHSLQIFIYVFFGVFFPVSLTRVRELQAALCPSLIPPDPHFLHPCSHTAKSRVCAGESGAEHEAQGLFLLWADAPTRVAAAAKYVMFSRSVPKHASSELVDSKIILGGMEGWGLKHTRDHAGPWGQKVCSVGCV